MQQAETGTLDVHLSHASLITMACPSTASISASTSSLPDRNAMSSGNGRRRSGC